MEDESSQSTSTWDQVKDQVLKNNARLSDIKGKLKNRDFLGAEDCALLNLLLSEDQGRRSTSLSETTIELTKQMARWSRVLAILTGVLAVAALADILIRVFHLAA